MTNSYNDIHNSKADLPDRRQPGRGAPRLAAPPAQVQGGEQRSVHRLRSRASRAPPPRPTSMCASAPALTSPLIWGLLWHIFENGWEDKQFISQRVFGMDQVRAEVAKWTSGGGRAGHRRARRAAQARGPADGREQARHRDLVHGRHAAHHRQQQCPRLLHPAAGTGQHGREPAAAPTSSVATTTSRAPRTWVSM